MVEEMELRKLFSNSQKLEQKLIQMENAIEVSPHNSRLEKLERKSEKLLLKLKQRNQRIRKLKAFIQETRTNGTHINVREVGNTGDTCETEARRSGGDKPLLCSLASGLDGFQICEFDDSQSSFASLDSQKIFVESTDLDTAPELQPSSSTASVRSESLNGTWISSVRKQDSRTLNRSVRDSHRGSSSTSSLIQLQSLNAMKQYASLCDPDLNKQNMEEMSLRPPCKKCLEQAGTGEVAKPIRSVRPRPLSRNHVCPVCSKKFFRMFQLNSHLKLHTNMRPFVCSVCDVSFRKRETLENHSRIHTEEKPFECSICQKKFTRKGTLSDHKRIHSGQYACPKKRCKYVATNRSNLKMHFHIVHGKYRRKYQPMKRVRKGLVCFKCEMPFSTVENIAKHFLIAHHKSREVEQPPKSTGHVQSSDGATCSYISNVDRASGQYVCGVCGDESTRWDAFESHVRTHDVSRGDIINSDKDPSTKLYGCHWCDKIFALQEVLFQHMLRTHVWSKPYECKLCCKSFYTEEAIKLHRRLRHNNEPGDVYSDSGWEPESSELSM